MEDLNGQLAIMCDMCSIWFHEEYSGLSKKQLNVIGEIDVCKWFCGRCLDNVDDRLMSVSNNLELSFFKPSCLSLSMSLPSLPSTALLSNMG